MKIIKQIIALLLLWAGSVRADSFTASAWTNDATANVDSDSIVYAYSFGSDDGAEINGVTFTGISGGDPSVSGKFLVSGIGSTYVNSTDNLPSGSGSSALADDFIYGGNPGTLTLEGLSAGTRYILSFYSVGWGDGTREITFSNNLVSATFDQELYGNDNGIRIDYDFYADSSTETIIMTPVNTNNCTFHVHGFALQSTPVHYVSPNGSSTAPYSSWATAATNMQDAVDAASADDTVLVTNGTYLLDNQISVTNAITLQSVNGPDVTILNAQQNARVLYLDGECLISGFTITNGYTSGFGGGVYCTGDSCVLTNCTISGNKTTEDFSYGGGCYKGTQINCTISGNKTTGTNYSNGGGCYQGTQTGCTISGNKTTGTNSSGGGCYGGTQMSCAISGNSAARSGGGCCYGTQINCIVYFNSAGSSGDNHYYSSMSYSCTTPLADGSGNITNNPCFTDADNGDYTLLPTSPCINAGNNDSVTTDTDLAGNDRILFETVDMGAYESAFMADAYDSTVSCITDTVSLSGSCAATSGTLSWTNAATGESGTVSFSDGTWTLDGIELAIGENIITISCGSYSTTIIITRAAEPMVDILTEAQTLGYETERINIAGTNSLDTVGLLSWTNAAAETSGSIDAETEADANWMIYDIDLETGANLITVSGTNAFGDAVSDTVTITRGLYHSGDSPVHYVSPDGSGIWPYTNWTTAAASVQDAVNAAVSNDTVLVTNGTYWLAAQISVTNAITLQSVNGPDVTILDAQQNGRVLYLDGEVLISGLTLTNGYLDDGDYGGGGVYCTGDSCVLTNCTISGNTNADDNGGGCFKGTLIDCTISGNTADSKGGGCYMGTQTDCTISGNSAGWYAGGCYKGTQTGCTISGNEAKGLNGSGGGCWYGTQTSCTISSNTASGTCGKGGGCYYGTQTGCSISGNTANDDGGGCYDGTQTGCILSGNTANDNGGGCYKGTQTGCILSGNTAYDDGGGCYYGTQTGCTISGNTADDDGGGCYYSTQTNCIVYFNSANGSGDNWYDTTPELSCCCTTPLPNDGSGNITNNPCFSDADNGDYTLLCTSPCIDAGTDSDQETDIDGNDRCVDGDSNGDAVTDIGAYEYQPDQTDSDGDAFTDYEEYVADTSMTNAADYFSVDIDGDSLSFSTAVGRSYTVEVCTNLVEGSWNTCTNLSGTGSTEELLTDPDEEKPEAFYRVQVELNE